MTNQFFFDIEKNDYPDFYPNGPIYNAVLWIETTESLPEENKQVLCYNEPTEEYFLCKREKNYDGTIVWKGDPQITHWQELSKPCK